MVLYIDEMPHIESKSSYIRNVKIAFTFSVNMVGPSFYKTSVSSFYLL